MADTREVAGSELTGAALSLKGTGDLDLVSHAAEPDEPARHMTLAAVPALPGSWLPAADENHRDTAAGRDVRYARWEAGSLLMLINGTAGAIAGAYVATRSVPVTALAGGAALLLAVLVMQRK